MTAPNASSAKNDGVVISPRDILFECPACHKSLVIDEAAQGMIVDCPQCHTNVIVPPKSTAPAPVAPAPTAPAEAPKAAETSLTDAINRLVTLGNQLKELQTQRTEIATNVAARLNEINRQMVMLARQETAHHQVLSEWNQIVGQIKAGGQKPAAPKGSTQANFKS